MTALLPLGLIAAGFIATAVYFIIVDAREARADRRRVEQERAHRREQAERERGWVG